MASILYKSITDSSFRRESQRKTRAGRQLSCGLSQRFSGVKIWDFVFYVTHLENVVLQYTYTGIQVQVLEDQYDICVSYSTGTGIQSAL